MMKWSEYFDILVLSNFNSLEAYSKIKSNNLLISYNGGELFDLHTSFMGQLISKTEHQSHIA